MWTDVKGICFPWFYTCIPPTDGYTHDSQEATQMSRHTGGWRTWEFYSNFWPSNWEKLCTVCQLLPLCIHSVFLWTRPSHPKVQLIYNRHDFLLDTLPGANVNDSSDAYRTLIYYREIPDGVGSDILAHGECLISRWPLFRISVYDMGHGTSVR